MAHRSRRRLFQSAGEAECDGAGTLNCFCGGDLCVCGDDGQDCLGCPKCEGAMDDIETFDEESNIRG